jgi:hypothetical protein
VRELAAATAAAAAAAAAGRAHAPSVSFPPFFLYLLNSPTKLKP